MVDDEVFEGYRDGFRDDREKMPESLGNRSESYRFGWLNGRDDRLGKPRAAARILRGEIEAIRTVERDKARI